MEKSQIIYKALLNISENYGKLQKATELNCLDTCGKCCDNPNIYARPSEMLPLANYLYENNQAYEVLNDLEENLNGIKHKNCIFYNKIDDTHRGRCTVYNHRPLICRSFGVFLRKARNGQREFSICKLIKENQEEQVKKLENEISKFDDYGLVDEISYSFYQVDLDLSFEKELQINLSLLEALKRVIFYRELQKNKGHE